MPKVRLITLDPGHFHAALVQKEMYANVSRHVHVFAPLGPDVVAHLGRVVGFNTRREQPTSWEVEVHAVPDFLERLLRDPPGNVVVLSGRNRAKIDYVLAALRAGLNVLADKPWIITHGDLPKLAEALELAESNGLIAYDIMTERFEITSILQQELLQDSAILGELEPGTEAEPGVFMESVHYLLKQVAGVPLRRPAWFFDTLQAGEGLTDVGTHLVDLVPWMLFPGQALDHRRELEVRSARRWPTVMSRDDFQRVTGEADFPEYLGPALRDGRLDYFCNTRVAYTVRGVHVTLNVLWDYEAAAGAGDTHLAIFRGTRASIEVRQGAEQKYRPEVYVVPRRPEERDTVLRALRHRVAEWQTDFAGVGLEVEKDRLRVTIPDTYRVGHEAHFAQVTRQFLAYLEEPRTLPAWEKPNMLAKYFVTTRGVELARQAPG